MTVHPAQEHSAACTKCDQWFENSKSQKLDQRRATSKLRGVNPLFLPGQAECFLSSQRASCYLGASWLEFWGHLINQKSGRGTENEMAICARKFHSEFPRGKREEGYSGGDS